MKRLEVSGAVRALYWSLGVKGLMRSPTLDRGNTVVKALRYKSEGRWFDSRWFHWNFSLT